LTLYGTGAQNHEPEKRSVAKRPHIYSRQSMNSREQLVSVSPKPMGVNAWWPRWPCASVRVAGDRLRADEQGIKSGVGCECNYTRDVWEDTKRRGHKCAMVFRRSSHLSFRETYSIHLTSLSIFTSFQTINKRPYINPKIHQGYQYV
jgi:hypothetical protein